MPVAREEGRGRAGAEGERREVNIKVSYKSSDVEIDMDENKSGWVSLSSLFGAEAAALEIKSVLCK